MSPLWPDFAVARAAWANAVKNGLVDDDEPRDGARRDSKRNYERKARRVPRRLATSYSL